MLGKLEKINDLRTVWKHEAHDFSKWLAKDENLELLAEEIGIEINFLEREASIGSFNVDILAEEESTGRKIVIENQLEVTNHDHLGKCIVYSAGYDAEIIIWIVKDVREEHRQAVDWLNEHTDDKVNFFVVKLELWKIENSPLAAKFNVVSRPNDWTKNIRTKRAGTLSETKMQQLEFWDSFKEYASSKNSKLRLRKTSPQHWYTVSYGNSKAHLELTVNSQTNLLGCEIYIHNSNEFFNHLLSNKEDIENVLGEKLEWMELPDKKASRIKLSTQCDFTNKNEWPKYFEWLKVSAEKFRDVFSKYNL